MSATHLDTDLQFRLDIEHDAVRVCPRGEVDLATAGGRWSRS
jgi:hypothetical protein